MLNIRIQDELWHEKTNLFIIIIDPIRIYAKLCFHLNREIHLTRKTCSEFINYTNHPRLKFLKQTLQRSCQISWKMKAI